MLSNTHMDAAMIVAHAPARGGTKPLIYGYVCVEEPDEVQISLLCNDMTKFCTLNSYRLGSIFIDRGVSDVSFARTGFSNVLEVLRRPEVHGVLVPALDHLSTHELVRTALLRLVRRTNSKVLMVYDLDGSGPTPLTGAVS